MGKLYLSPEQIANNRIRSAQPREVASFVEIIQILIHSKIGGNLGENEFFLWHEHLQLDIFM